MLKMQHNAYDLQEKTTFLKKNINIKYKLQYKFLRSSCLLTSQSQSSKSSSLEHPSILSVPKSKTMGVRDS